MNQPKHPTQWSWVFLSQKIKWQFKGRPCHTASSSFKEWQSPDGLTDILSVYLPSLLSRKRTRGLRDDCWSASTVYCKAEKTTDLSYFMSDLKSDSQNAKQHIESYILHGNIERFAFIFRVINCDVGLTNTLLGTGSASAECVGETDFCFNTVWGKHNNINYICQHNSTTLQQLDLL